MGDESSCRLPLEISQTEALAMQPLVPYSLQSHRCRSLQEYQAELVNRFELLPLRSPNKATLGRRIQDVAVEIRLRTPQSGGTRG